MPHTVRVRVLDVGQGDAIVGVLPGGNRAFVVDVYNADKVLDFLEVAGVSEVVLFLSHSDQDHTAGVSDFLAEFPSRGRILAIFYNQDRLNAAARSEYVTLTRTIGSFSRQEERGAPGFVYEQFNTRLNGMTDFAALFPAGSRVRVVHPSYSDQSCLVGQDTNETAGVLMVEAATSDSRSHRMLLAADVQLTGMSLMLSRDPVEPLEADVLKFPHHGAWPEARPGIGDVPKRTLEDFLRAVRPSVVILSVGFDNIYGHVRQEVFTLLESYQRDTGRLASLKCTQFTSTCLGSTSLSNAGPLSDAHCAGDVEVVLGYVGDGGAIRVLTHAGNHPARVAQVHRSGCARCAFLPGSMAEGT